MNTIKFLRDKIKQYEEDLKIMLNAAKNIDQIKTARIKSEFEDLIALKIMDITRIISEIKQFIRDERKKRK